MAALVGGLIDYVAGFVTTRQVRRHCHCSSGGGRRGALTVRGAGERQNTHPLPR